MNYRDELTKAMTMLGEHQSSVFIGQAVVDKGTAMTETFRGVPLEKKIELPVFEDVQMGLATGMALAGALPITIYPRFNFLLLATNQLVLHLDKLPIYSNGGYRPKVIIRTAVATPNPLNPQCQHLGNFADAFRLMLKTVEVRVLDAAEKIMPCYRKAMERDGSTLLVEFTEMYS